jgi:hypothetical protein
MWHSTHMPLVLLDVFMLRLSKFEVLLPCVVNANHRVRLIVQIRAELKYRRVNRIIEIFQVQAKLMRP